MISCKFCEIIYYPKNDEKATFANEKNSAAKIKQNHTLDKFN